MTRLHGSLAGFDVRQVAVLETTPHAQAHEGYKKETKLYIE